MTSSNSTNEKCEKKSLWEREYSLKVWCFRLLLWVILIGFIFTLFAEVIIGTWMPSRVRGVETWNQFTSVILGIVATVVSIVSVFMGFKSYDDSSKLQLTCIQTLDHIKNMEQNLFKFNFQADVEHRRGPDNAKWQPDSMPMRE